MFRSFMSLALEEARAAANRGETPVGAVIVDPGTNDVVARDGNRVREQASALAHAEMLVLAHAARALGRERLTGLDLYVTLEPCPMCAGAISSMRLRRLYYAASDPKSGGVETGARVFDHPQCHHAPEIYAGIDEAASTQLLQAFFAARR